MTHENKKADTEVSSMRRTYRVYVGGVFRNGGSGEVAPIKDHDDCTTSYVSTANRKDARDAVLAARAAHTRWSGKTGYERGRALYQTAETIYERRDQFIEAIVRHEKVNSYSATRIVAEAIDRWIWWSGWADKLEEIRGSTASAVDPYLNIPTNVSLGVVVALASQESSFLGLVDVLLPVLVPGNTTVLLPSERYPIPAMLLAEVLAVSDFPPGTVNIITGNWAEVTPWLASHEDIDGIDLAGATRVIDGAPLWKTLEKAASSSFTKVTRPFSTKMASASSTEQVHENKVDHDGYHTKDPDRALSFTEQKSIWIACGK
jgi:acyl-CoA reductase-like NAD-dependent aldehyde dehydrogenase